MSCTTTPSLLTLNPKLEVTIKIIRPCSASKLVSTGQWHPMLVPEWGPGGHLVSHRGTLIRCPNLRPIRYPMIRQAANDRTRNKSLSYLARALQVRSGKTDRNDTREFEYRPWALHDFSLAFLWGDEGEVQAFSDSVPKGFPPSRFTDGTRRAHLGKKRKGARAGIANTIPRLFVHSSMRRRTPSRVIIDPPKAGPFRSPP